MEILVPLGLWVMIAVIVVAAIWGGVQTRREQNETLRRAVESGQQLTPETIAALLRKPGRTAEQDIRGGITLSFLALGFLFAGAIASGLIPGLSGWDREAGIGFAVAAAIVGSIGVGQLIAGFVRRDRTEK